VNVNGDLKKKRQPHQMAGRPIITKVANLTGYTQEKLPTLLVDYVNQQLPLSFSSSPLILQVVKEGVLHVHQSISCNMQHAFHIREEDTDELSDFKRCVASSNFFGTPRYDDVEFHESDGMHYLFLLYVDLMHE
jgi:hypothetical protein